MSLRIDRAGADCRLVDAGRWAHQRWGISVGGPMDPVAWQLAGALTASDASFCALEITLGGTVITVLDRPVVLAVCGALSHVFVDNEEVPANRPLWLTVGAVLRIPVLPLGSRCYLAAHGGLEVPRVLGSQSALPGVGAPELLEGGLKAQMVIPLHSQGLPRPAHWRHDVSASWPKWGLPPLHWPHDEQQPFRFVKTTPDSVPDEVLRAFLTSIWTVSSDIDRQGLRLTGKSLPWAQLDSRNSKPTVAGSIQVTPSGLPIVLAADRQPTGGYPVLGAIASVDHCRLGQLRPGDRMTFSMVDVPEAQRLLHKQASGLALLKDEIKRRLGPGLDT